MRTKLLEYFSRKFVIAIISLGCGYGLLIADKALGDWAMLVGVVMAFYNGSNVAETFAQVKLGKQVDVNVAPK